MTNAQLARFAKDIQLEAHTRALPAKVQVLRDAVAKAAGFTDGTALASSPGYDPAPRRSAGGSPGPGSTSAILFRNSAKQPPTDR
jgi:hypothetical protein